MDRIVGFAAALPDLVKAIADITASLEQITLRLALFGLFLYTLYRWIRHR
jgi:hypothetical protein